MGGVRNHFQLVESDLAIVRSSPHGKMNRDARQNTVRTGFRIRSMGYKRGILRENIEGR